jgi:hypothetical protein
VDGESHEHLTGVFGLHTRTARMRLGEEYIELTEFLAPPGRPAPADARSNDRWFQHTAIIVSDMDRPYQWLSEHKVQHASPRPQLLPAWNKNAGGIRAFYSATRTVTRWRSSGSPQITATRSGTLPRTNFFWE